MLLPRKSDLSLSIRLTNFFQRRRFNRRAITIIGIKREVFFRELFQNRFTYNRLQARYVKEGRMLKPDRLIGAWMYNHRIENLSSSQSIALFPCEIHQSLAAVVFHFQFVRSLKSGLPGETKSFTVVAHVHDSLS